MGRTILCNKCHSTFDEDILKKRNSENECPVCGASLLEGNDNGNSVHNNALDKDGQEDWITWYYYGTKDKKGRKEDDYAFLEDEPIDLDEFGDKFFLIKEFKAPPESKYGLDAVKEILQTYIPDAFITAEKKEPEIHCPRCFSTQFQLVPRKFSLLTGFATNKVDRICLKCNKRF